jgi:transposase
MTKPYQKCTLTLTTEETLTLKQLALNHRHVDFRRKAAGLLQLAQGTRPKEIARELDVTQQSVYLWLGAWREHGLVGLMGGHAGGRHPALPTEMLDTAEAIARREALSLPLLAKAVEATHHCPLPCCLVTLGNGLKARGFSFKRTRFSLKKNAPKRSLLPSKTC